MFGEQSTRWASQKQWTAGGIPGEAPSPLPACPPVCVPTWLSAATPSCWGRSPISGVFVWVGRGGEGRPEGLPESCRPRGFQLESIRVSQQHTLGWPALGPHTSVANLLRVLGTGGLWTTQKACLEVAEKACHSPITSVSSSPSFAETPHRPTFHLSPFTLQSPGVRVFVSGGLHEHAPHRHPTNLSVCSHQAVCGLHLLPHFLGEGRPLASPPSGATPPALREHPLPPENCQNEPHHGPCTFDSGTRHFPRLHSPVSSDGLLPLPCATLCRPCCPGLSTAFPEPSCMMPAPFPSTSPTSSPSLSAFSE